MPIYEYACSSCDHRADILHGINDPGPNFCPSCGSEGTMKKVFAAPAIHFRGSGWAKKDRRTATKATKSDAGDGEADATDRADKPETADKAAPASPADKPDKASGGDATPKPGKPAKGSPSSKSSTTTGSGD